MKFIGFKQGGNMTIGEIVNLIVAILSFALAAISVITVILTLRQNNKMIEASGGTTIKISFDTDLREYTFELNMQSFEALENMTFTSNQNL